MKQRLYEKWPGALLMCVGVFIAYFAICVTYATLVLRGSGPDVIGSFYERMRNIFVGIFGLYCCWFFFLRRRPRKSDERHNVVTQQPVSRLSNSVKTDPESASTQPAANSSGLMEALKEEMFQLELDRGRGKVSVEEYDKSKLGLEKLLIRALKPRSETTDLFRPISPYRPRSLQSQPTVAIEQPPNPAKPATSNPAQSSVEEWAADLKRKKDYPRLAAAIADKSSEEYPWPKAKAATSVLRDAGPAAVEAILQLIASKKYCNVDLALLLVEIGDPRSAPVLRPFVLKRQFSGQPSNQSIVEAFVARLDDGFQSELAARNTADEAAAETRLTAVGAGIPLREYSAAYIFHTRARNKEVLDSLKIAIEGGERFPLDAPYQIALTHGPTADFIAVLVRLPTVNDESVALNKQIMKWFSEVGVGEPDDRETLRAPLPGRLSRGLRYISSEYSVLEIIDCLEKGP